MIVAGFGFRGKATRASLDDALTRAGGRVDVFATAADKAETSEMIAFGADHGVRVVGVRDEALTMQATLTVSQASQSVRKTGSVAEAAALAAAGPGARLLAPRVVSSDRLATCALAEGHGP
jgi:cobalt-precorrin 5A hydrolase